MRKPDQKLPLLFICVIMWILLLGFLEELEFARGTGAWVLDLFLLLGLLGFFAAVLIHVSAILTLRDMLKVEEKLASRPVYILKRSRPVPRLVWFTFGLSCLFAIWWVKWIGDGITARLPQFTIALVLSLLLLAFLMSLWRAVWRHRSELDRFDSERVALAAQGLTHIWRNRLQEVRREDVKEIRVYIDHQVKIAITTSWGGFDFNSHIEGFNQVAEAVFALSDKIKIFGRAEKLPSEVRDFLKRKKLIQ